MNGYSFQQIREPVETSAAIPENEQSVEKILSDEQMAKVDSV